MVVVFRLVGDVLLCTGFLSYSGPFNQEFRNKLLQTWRKEMRTRRIPYTENLNLIEALVDNATVRTQQHLYIFITYLLAFALMMGDIIWSRLASGTCKVCPTTSCPFRTESS